MVCLGRKLMQEIDKVVALLKVLDTIDSKNQFHYITMCSDLSGNVFNGADVPLSQFDNLDEAKEKLVNLIITQVRR